MRWCMGARVCVSDSGSPRGEFFFGGFGTAPRGLIAAFCWSSCAHTHGHAPGLVGTRACEAQRAQGGACAARSRWGLPRAFQMLFFLEPCVCATRRTAPQRRVRRSDLASCHHMRAMGPVRVERGACGHVAGAMRRAPVRARGEQHAIMVAWLLWSPWLRIFGIGADKG